MWVHRENFKFWLLILYVFANPPRLPFRILCVWIYLGYLLVGLFGEVEHVGGEERGTVLLEVLLVSLKHAIEPRQELLGAVVRVEDHGHAIVLSHLPHVQSTLQIYKNPKFQ